jgi:hypothetical protein
MVHHQVDSLDVHPTGSEIGRNENPDGKALQVVHLLGSLRLLE